MEYTHITGALLEYLVRGLLRNCGFTNVKPDNIYTYESNGLFFVNGKGAAHDADVLMNPPIQMPFTYPTQLLFECKAYTSKVSLPVIRNAYGLRHDLNDFEIVTLDSLRSRRNNRRAQYAIEDRRRYNFQVGIAVIGGFTNPAIEFAANHKIPLLSLSWFLNPTLIRNFSEINQNLIDHLPQSHVNNLYEFLKDRNAELEQSKYTLANELLRSNNVIGDIITWANRTINLCFVGLLETGNMIFLFNSSANNILEESRRSSVLTAEIHWENESANLWTLDVYERDFPESRSTYRFYLPLGIYKDWERLNFDKAAALEIKAEFFSRIFVFNQKNNPNTPFSIIYINEEWLRLLRQETDDHDLN